MVEYVGIDVYVCNECKAITTKPVWMMEGSKCPNCGCKDKEIRGKYYDGRIWIDGCLAQGDGRQGRLGRREAQRLVVDLDRAAADVDAVDVLPDELADERVLLAVGIAFQRHLEEVGEDAAEAGDEGEFLALYQLGAGAGVGRKLVVGAHHLLAFPEGTHDGSHFTFESIKDSHSYFSHCFFPFFGWLMFNGFCS